MTDRNPVEQFQETTQVRIDEFWELMKAELAKEPPVALEGTVIDAVPIDAAPSKELSPIETQEVAVREIPTAADLAADAVLAANLREELEDMWNTRRENPAEFYAGLEDSQATLERLIKKHNKKTGYVEPQPEPVPAERAAEELGLEWPQPAWRNPNAHEASIETTQFPRLDKLMRP